MVTKKSGIFTDGMKTSEFWFSVVVVIAATVLAFAGKITDAQWMVIAAADASAYSLSRGLAK